MLVGGLPYVSTAQLPNYLIAQVLNLATSGQQAQACLDASEEIDSYFRGRYALPVSAVGTDVVRIAGWIAAYHLVYDIIGVAAQADTNKGIERKYEMAIDWCKGVQRQAVHPDITLVVNQPGDPVHDIPQVFSNTPRGWTTRSGPQRI